MSLKEALIIFTKEPIEGKVKTRLARTITNEKATKIYKLMLENLLELKLRKDIDIYIALDCFTNDYKSFFKNSNLFFQKGNNIGEKMSNAFKEVYKYGYDNVVLVGADIPQLDESIINNAFENSKKHEAIVSKTEDEGYYLIGFQKNTFTSRAFKIDFSQNVYKKTMTCLKHLRVKEGKKLFDIDELDDLKKFANLDNINTNKKLQEYSKELLRKLAKISVIIPVYYEKDNLEKTIEHLKKSAKDINSFEIIVCDTQDRTTIDDINCKSIKAVISKKAGRSYQLNHGASFAQGDIFLFLHADTLVPKNWDEDIINLFSKNKEIAGAFKLGINTNIKILKIIEFFANLRVMFTNTPYGDQGQFFSSAIFNKINGYDEIPLMEDIQIIKKLKKENLKIKILNKKIYTSDRRWKKEGILYTTTRNRILSTLYFLGVSSQKLKRYYKF